MEKLLSFLLLALLISACTWDNEEDLYPDLPADACTTDITYTADIKPIFDANGCAGCHPAVASPDLTNYQSASAFALQGDSLLYKVVAHAGVPQNLYMPQGQPMIDSCAIHKILAWIGAGAPE